MRYCLLFVMVLAAAVVGQTTTPIGVNYTPQPSKSGVITWASGTFITKDRASVVAPVRGFEVMDTSSGGVLKAHLLNDFDVAGRKVWLNYKIPSSGGAIQRVGLIFDEIDSAGTTIPKGGLILWY